MLSADTRQMCSSETKQRSTIAKGLCPFAILSSCLVSAADTCLVSAADICLVSKEDRSCFKRRHNSCPNLLLRQDRYFLLRQDRCLLLRKGRCLLLRQDICSSLREGVWSQIIQKCSKWVKNGPQDLRINPRARHGHVLASVTSPTAKKADKISAKLPINRPQRPLLIWLRALG